ncbi:unnamed protein product [Urochloa decumbens]|uniref:F-box domain-containing protein n=1 Tax=Urochloa decumbens TaxID=240449 RepID=A0ABC9CBP2_9POAL
MEVAAKRSRAAGGSAPDRLSALPDDLRRRVLSFLSSRQSVRTTVLSKQWVDLWRSVPAINLYSLEFERERKRNNALRKMNDFTSKFLMLHNTECLDVFRLHIPSYIRYYHPRLDVHRWIPRGIKYQPLVIEIYAHQSVIPCLGSAFHRLKKLDLSDLSLDHSFSERLNSGCPVLEDLVLDGCSNEFAGGIQSDTLKNLVVNYCRSDVAVALVVRAPCLASLCFKFGVSQKGQTILVGSLFNVISLTLEGFGATAFLDKELDNFPTFDNFRTLSLMRCPSSKSDVQKFKALGRFLQKSPNLEKLTMQHFWYSEGTERKALKCDQPFLETVRPVVGPIEFPVLENLRNLFLNKCDLRDNFRILRHLLQSSPNLETLTVWCCELPEGPAEGKGRAKSRSLNLVCCQCNKLKSTEIIYKKGGKVQELVNFLLDISHSAPENKMTLTKV